MLAEPSMPERRPSPGLSINLSSNNPFRNRATSPGFSSPANQSDRSSSASRPMSRNPFLSTFEAEFNKEARKTDLIDMSASMTASPKKDTFSNGSAAEELFKNLTIEEDDNRRRAPPPRPTANRSGTEPRAGHRPSRSDEEREKQRGPPRGPPRPRGPPEPRRPAPNSPDRRERRPRRNSDSSIIDRAAQEKEDRRRRERRKERDEKDRDGKSSSSRKVRKPQGLDLIDKLDVTGIYGPSMIHHDGPYDAVQPHRNRKKDVRAPMHAFPAGSANNSLGGSGPLNQKIDLDRIHGRGAEGFTDFGAAGDSEWKKPMRPEGEFSAKGREDIVHGQQTHGLGTSTFLEGAPASRTAVEQDFEQKRANEINGLGRKKSIAQRFRGISQPRRQYGDGARMQSPEARYGGQTSPQGPYSAGPLAQNKTTELNPFFDEYNNAYDSKAAAIQAKDDSPPRAPLQRAITTESAGSVGESKPTGFLGRMKSIKGARRRQA